ncbi:M16 family metallopeptidase [Desulforhopalus sp. 52FAK]
MYRILIAAFVVLFLLSYQLTNTRIALATGDSGAHPGITEFIWPYQESPLSPDPTITRGTLANGLSYMIKENHEPDDRVAAYLVVMAGSNEERDDQQGVAHFLEHLMFNGSTHFPPGTLVEYFQSIGMDFGRDTNAYTGFDRTVYHLILPTGDDDELGVGCKILADYARGALLLDSEIDKERGVIFSEKRSRDSARYRNQLVYTKFAFDGTRYPNRLPIGTESVLKSADHELLKDFYDGWYRPDNITLVLVGDLSVESAEQIIIKHFAGLKSVGAMPARPEFGRMKHTGLNVLYNYEPDLGSTNVSIESLWDVTPQPPDIDSKKRDLNRIIADLIIGYRLQADEEKSEQPYTHAQYSSGNVARKIGYGSMYAVTDKSNWAATLEKIYEVLEYAKRYGFTSAEFERAKAEINSELQKNVQTQSSLHSRVIAERMVNNLLDRDVYMSPNQELELYTQILDETTVEDISKGFNEIWDKPRRLITVTGDVQLKKPENEVIKALYKKLTNKVIAKKAAVPEIVFPYLRLSDSKTTLLQTEEFPDIGMTRYTLTNGLVINYKQTDYEPNKVRIAAHFGAGEQDEPMPGSSAVAADVINLSGTNTLSLSELETVSAKSSVDLSFHMGRSSSSWTGSSLSSDFTIMVQFLYTVLLDPGFDQTAYTKVMQGMEMMKNRLSKDIDGAVLYEVQPFFAGGNKHYGLVPWEELSVLDFQQMKSWIQKIFDFGDLEISIVGDIESDEVLTVLTQYFGSLTLREPPLRLMDEQINFPEGETLKLTVNSEIAKSILFLTWPTDDFWDIGRTRRLSIVAALLEDRVRKVVREELGASYSPSVSSYGSRMHPGYGIMQVEIEVEDGKEEMVLDALKKLVDDFLKDGVTEVELERAKRPVLTSVYENIQTNQYWLYSVLTLSSSFKEQLNWPTNIVSDIKSISVNEINTLLAKYIQSNKMATAIIDTNVVVKETSKTDGSNVPSAKATVH